MVQNSNKKSSKQKEKSDEKYPNSGRKQIILKNFKRVLLICLSIIVFYPPFLRGLYFEPDQLPTEIFVFVVFAAFWVYKHMKKDRRFLQTPIEYASFGFVVVYLLAILVAVGTRLAISEWLKYCMYFAVFLMLTELVDTYRSKRMILWVVVASGIGISILGIDGAAGGHVSNVFNKFFEMTAIPVKFFSLYNNGRIYSTLQYPNTLAAYLMAVFFIALGLSVTADKLVTKAIAGAGSFVVLITFVFTLSRGAYLLMPIVSLVFLLVLPKGNRVKGMIYVAMPVMAAAFVSIKLSGYIAKPAGFETNIWIWVFVGAILSALLIVAGSFLVTWLERVNWKVYAGVMGGVFALLLIGIIYVFNATMPLELAHSPEQKDGSISVRKSAVLKPEREYKLVYDVEASVSKDKPYAYVVRISNRSEKNILFGGQTSLATFSEKGTQGLQNREVNFKVPSETRIIDVTFTNYYQGTKAVFENAKIVDAISGKTVKNITLKYKYLPESITTRFEDISANISAIQRSIYYKDGLKIMKDRLLLGGGGGAWTLLYYSYQSYLYYSNQAHNFFLQVGVETGVLGLLVTALLLLSILLLYLTEYLKGKEDNEEDKNDRILQSVLLTSIIALFAHSAIDFDLSLAAVFLLLWELIALYNVRNKMRASVAGGELPAKSSEEMDQEVMEPVNKMQNCAKIFIDHVTRLISNIKKCSIPPSLGFVTTILILMIPILYVFASGYAGAASKALKEQKLDQAISGFQKAASLDVFKPEYKIDYANLLIRKPKVTQQEINLANEQIRKAENLTKRDSKLTAQIGAYYYSIGQPEKGLSYIDKAISLRPFRPEEWQQKVGMYYQLAMSNFKKNQAESALKYVDQMFAVIEEAKKVSITSINPFVFNTATSEMLERMKYAKDNITQKKTIIVDEVIFNNLPEMDVNSDGIPDQWTPNNPDQVKMTSVDGLMVVENSDPKAANYIQTRTLSLAAGKKYRVEVELANSKNVKSILYYISGVSKKSEELKQADNVYSTEFEVPGDFKPGTNLLRLYIRGRYEVKGIKVLEVNKK